MEIKEWKLPPRDLTLSLQDVHVWLVSLNQPNDYVQQLLGSLSAEEPSRGDRFIFKRDRRRFITSHGILRMILSNYTGIDPAQLEFSYEPNGKPYLSKEFNPSNIRFNLSHSNELAICGVTRDREIGVDLEYIRPIPELEKLASKYFSNDKRDLFEIIPEGQKMECFFTTWTSMEAYLKALGVGLTNLLEYPGGYPLPSEPIKYFQIIKDTQKSTLWTMVRFSPSSGYVGALVVEGYSLMLSGWQWNQF